MADKKVENAVKAMQDRAWQQRGETILLHPMCLANGRRRGTVSQDTERFDVVEVDGLSPETCDYCGRPLNEEGS